MPEFVPRLLGAGAVMIPAPVATQAPQRLMTARLLVARLLAMRLLGA